MLGSLTWVMCRARMRRFRREKHWEQVNSFCCNGKKCTMAPRSWERACAVLGSWLCQETREKKIGDGFGEPGERTWETHQSLAPYRDMLILFCHSKLARYQLF